MRQPPPAINVSQVSNNRNGTPPRTQGRVEPRQDMWVSEEFTSHSAARARERSLQQSMQSSSGQKSVDSRTTTTTPSSFSRSHRSAYKAFTADDLTAPKRQIQQNFWEQENFAGRKSRGHTPTRGKKTFSGAPHVQDTPEMTDLVIGSRDLNYYHEKHEEAAGMGNMMVGMAGYSGQENDIGDGKKTGRKMLSGAVHVQDTANLQHLICGSDGWQEIKDRHDEMLGSKHADLFYRSAGYSNQNDDAGTGRSTGKREFFGAPHVQDTPLVGVLVGSDKLQEHRDAFDTKIDRSGMFRGMAGRCEQDDDKNDGKKNGKRSFLGAPHVNDTPDLCDLVCGPGLKHVYKAHENPELAGMFDGCAGLNLQDEDLIGPRASGKKTLADTHPAKISNVKKDVFDGDLSDPSQRDWSSGRMRFNRYELPSLFISHGQGPLPLMVDARQPAIRCLTKIPSMCQVDKTNVRCILFISAHWETHQCLEVTMQNTQRQKLHYDYRGAPPECYELEGHCHPPGDPEVSSWIINQLQVAGFGVRSNPSRNLDHGVFVPLLLMPDLQGLPVVQLSLPGLRGQKGSEVAQQCLEIGKSLEPLRSRGLLIIGSGMATNSVAKESHMERWTRHLKKVCCDVDAQERYESLRTWTSTLPHAREVHGREEHLLPLLVAAGASSKSRGQVLGDFRENGLALTHFSFA